MRANNDAKDDFYTRLILIDAEAAVTWFRKIQKRHVGGSGK